MEREGVVNRIPWARFAAEFVVIVVGVLVALAVDASVSERSDQANAAQYLEWIRDDLDATAPTLSEAMGVDADASEAATLLLDTLDAVPLPGADTLVRMFGRLTQSVTFTPVLSTIDAMIESGDLQLITDPTVRRALLRYRSSAEAFEGVVAKWNPYEAAAVHSIGRVTCPRFECGVDWSELAGSPAFRSDIFNLGRAAQSRVQGMSDVEAAITELSDALEAAGLDPL